MDKAVSLDFGFGGSDKRIAHLRPKQSICGAAAQQIVRHFLRRPKVAPWIVHDLRPGQISGGADSLRQRFAVAGGIAEGRGAAAANGLEDAVA